MKRSDIAVIILIVSISLLVGYFIGNAVIGAPKQKTLQAEVVEPISAEVTEPSSKIFNDSAINSAVPITIGNPSNQQPFN